MDRLDKYLCDAGVGSRSRVKVLLKAGRIKVDGITAKDGSVKIDGAVAQVTFDGTIIGRKTRTVLLLNKPAGYMTATEDKNDKTVMELLPSQYQRLRPVGRLDKATEGLLLFTDDGDLLHRLISPKKQVPKVYYAEHEGIAESPDVQAFAEGITLGDGTKCLPAKLEILSEGKAYITVCEGKYHQVRRMMASRGLPVTYLERRQEDGITLEGVERGAFRLLSSREIAQIEGLSSVD